MSKLSRLLASNQFTITSELTPPKGTELDELIAKATALNKRVHAFNLTDSHAANMAMDPVAVGHLLLDCGVEPIVQITARDRNRIAIQGWMLGAAALGVKNIVCMGGDPPANGDHPDAKAVFDLYTAEILTAAYALQHGHDLAGNPINGNPSFCIGAVVNPGARDRAQELDNLRRKIDAGAEFFQTQAVYEPAAFESFISKVGANARILAGIIPIRSTKMAKFMNHKIPGIMVPDALIKRIAAAEDGDGDVGAISIEIAAEIIQKIGPMCQGVHLMTIGSEDKIPAILDAAGIQARTAA